MVCLGGYSQSPIKYVNELDFCDKLNYSYILGLSII